MNNSYQVSLRAMVSLIFLLPLFFIPGTSFPIGASKVILVVLALVIAFGALLIDSFKREDLTLPKSSIILLSILLPVIYYISSIASATPELSLFGYIFEPGTTASLLIFSAILLVTATVFNSREKLFKGYSALFISLGILGIFALVKVISGGNILVFGNFAGNMGNPVGVWTDYALVFGLLSILSLFALGMLSLKGITKAVVSLVFALSIFLLAVINFSTAWIIVLALSATLLIYFATAEKRSGEVSTGKMKQGMAAAGILVAISLIFVFNPTVSSTSGSLSNGISNFFGVSNTYVRPTLSTTLSISKAALGENPILGSGPNTFSKSWLKYKPADVNNTPFWGVAFPFGLGFVPTQLASTGILGISAWAVFFALFAILGFRVFSRSPQDKFDRFLVLGSFLGSLFLWISFFVYMPSFTVLTLAFIFTGLLLASASVTGVIESKTIALSRNTITHFVSVLVIVALALGTLAFAIVAYQKSFSQIYFQKALVQANTSGSSIESVEGNIAKAINLSPADIFWASLSEIEIAKANAALNATSGTSEENAVAFQTALSQSILYAQNAISLNPTYSNWIALSNVYSSLVPAPFSVTGAYDSAKSALASAKELNPYSPEVSLLTARLELSNKNVSLARESVTQAIAQKADYADAHFFLSQLEINQGNLSQAIRSAETGALLSPGNPGVLLQLGILKYENRDYRGAMEAMNQALALVPDYANAKFYLGLSQDKLDMSKEAIATFEELIVTNPDNELLESILANLRANKDALAGLDNSGTTAPIRGQ